jgi:hypothetical protein
VNRPDSTHAGLIDACTTASLELLQRNLSPAGTSNSRRLMADPSPTHRCTFRLIRARLYTSFVRGPKAPGCTREGWIGAARHAALP